MAGFVVLSIYGGKRSESFRVQLRPVDVEISEGCLENKPPVIQLISNFRLYLDHVTEHQVIRVGGFAPAAVEIQGPVRPRRRFHKPLPVILVEQWCIVARGKAVLIDSIHGPFAQAFPDSKSALV